ncbi:hypothetical protein A9G11_11895 [Gilliamella sp. wkB108]|uniref:antiterminator Q family protein n=1 Tax=Gilliamella sp. wkB108 TaxID=3120256 RepID=UPI00080EA48F|nr:antiterminator Q family protein [Gilliamella apicola]OCG28201.1 hypothetical protein A9G11_11895 [Gilliamella apicola]
MRDTKDILTAWKNTRILRRIGTEYPSQSSGIKGAARENDYRQYLTEDEAEKVDNAVLRLKDDNYSHWIILTAYYLRGISCNAQAKVIGRRPHDIIHLLNEAECFIRGYIFEFFKKES